MLLKFVVGNQDQYNIEFKFNKFTGKSGFKVNGEAAGDYFILTAKKHELIIREEAEEHEIIIEMITPKFLAPFKKGWKYVVSVDGLEFKTFED